MNYIGQIRGFWRAHEEHSFTTTEVAVYFRLLEICNICQWKNPFKRNNSKIEADLGISFNTLKNARNRLRQTGLINFETRNGSSNVSYTLSNFDKVSSEVDVKVGDEVTNEVGNEVLPAKDKLNVNKTKPPPLPPKGGNWDFVEKEFEKAFFDWIEYKKQRGNGYKTQQSAELAYKKLKEIACGNGETAAAAVEQSMANNWSGLFEVKGKKSNNCNNLNDLWT
jgi:hypothetical protein